MISSSEQAFLETPIGTVKEIADETYAVNAPFWGFPNVVYFLGSGGMWTLIDTGVAETPQYAVAPFLESHGGFESLELVLGTHGHVDHIGGNSWIKERAPKARFGLGALDAGWAEDPDRHYSQLYQFGAPGPWRPEGETEKLIRDSCGEAVAIDRLFLGGERIKFGAGREIETVHLGAHSPGQMLYLDNASACMFSGDAVQNAGIYNSDQQVRDFPMYRTVADYRRSLEIIRSVQLERLCTGHAGIYTGSEIDSFIDEALNWSEQFTHTLEDAARDLGDFSLEQIVAQVSILLPEYAVGLQIRVTTAEHLDELVRAGALSPRIVAGEKRWAAVTTIQ